MYTGRTAYAGEAKSDKSKRLAQAYRTRYLINENGDEESQRKQRKRIEGLKSINKYPARYGSDGVERFVDQLERNEHIPLPYDAEFITRFEMVNCPPDILVTNYSMLEYMLMRQMESNIWDNTKEWLNHSEENRLMIVLDEAHMYNHPSPRYLMHDLGKTPTQSKDHNRYLFSPFELELPMQLIVISLHEVNYSCIIGYANVKTADMVVLASFIESNHEYPKTLISMLTDRYGTDKI